MINIKQYISEPDIDLIKEEFNNRINVYDSILNLLIDFSSYFIKHNEKHIKLFSKKNEMDTMMVRVHQMYVRSKEKIKSMRASLIFEYEKFETNNGVYPTLIKNKNVAFHIK